MPNRLLAIILMTFLITPVRAARRPRSSWWVVRSANFDSRVSRELEDAARHEGAKLEFIEKAPERAPRPGTLGIIFNRSPSPEVFLDELKREVRSPAPAEPAAREGYFLEVSYLGARPAWIKVTASSPLGFHHALRRIPQVLHARPAQLASALAPAAKDVRVAPGGRRADVADFPSFPERGIVEGFYGKPWSHQDRLAVIRFEGAHGMNVYYYAPKDDPYHRELWREPYPPAEMARLGELAETAKSNFVDFCFAVSPGLSMTYSSDEDFTTLTNKLASVGQLGVNCFALFLDDVPQDLQNPDDKARFTTLAQAHAYVINKLYAYLNEKFPGSRLVVTPTVYTNDWGSRDYIRELGAGVNPAVPLVWTGPKVVSPRITVADAKEWGELLHRKPLIWDNFPVNDGIGWRLNLGPVRGRDPELPSAVAGLFSNPMNQARASLIPLGTIADYVWNSSAYQPDVALQRAVREQYGRNAVRDMRVYLATYGDYWWDENIFNPLFVESRRPFSVRSERRHAAELDREVRALRRRATYREIAAEFGPFPEKVRRRIAEVLEDPAFRHRPGEVLEWRADHDTLRGARVAEGFRLDGDFGKWENQAVYDLRDRGQISNGARLWRGPEQFAIRFALGWDADYFYIGLDVTDPELYQPFTGRDIAKGDGIALLLETAFRKNFDKHHADGDEYHLLFSPGDFVQVQPSVYSEEDYLPPRPVPRDYNKEIKTAWRKTPKGYSGDIAIPARWFDGAFHPGYEIGLGLRARKAFPAPAAARGAEEEVPRIVFRSKSDRLFPLSFGSPASYQRLVLMQASGK